MIGGRPGLATALLVVAVACSNESTSPVEVPTPTSVVVSPSALTFSSLGETAQLTATVHDQNGQAVASATVAWVSANTAVATVDGNGLVSAAGQGATNIVVTAGSTASASVGVMVEQVPHTIVLSEPPDSLAVGDSIQMTAEAFDALSNAVAGVTFEWSSSDTTIATVDQQGWVRGKSAGSAEITVTAGPAASASVGVMVEQVPHTIVLSEFPDSLAVGDSIQMTAEALDGLGSPIANVTFEWSSGDTTIVTVDQQGWVRARGAGSTEITVTLAEVSASKSLRVFRDRDRDERAALEAFYHATNGPNWKNNTNWLSDKPVGQWYGVETDASGNVVGLNFNENGLRGRLPAELTDLSNLKELFLWGEWGGEPDLTGPIPPGLAALSNLTVLVLGSNDFTGEVPPELADLVNLTKLSLVQNKLTGPIPPSWDASPNWNSSPWATTTLPERFLQKSGT